MVISVVMFAGFQVLADVLRPVVMVLFGAFLREITISETLGFWGGLDNRFGGVWNQSRQGSTDAFSLQGFTAFSDEFNSRVM